MKSHHLILTFYITEITETFLESYDAVKTVLEFYIHISLIEQKLAEKLLAVL